MKRLFHLSPSGNAAQILPFTEDVLSGAEGGRSDERRRFSAKYFCFYAIA